MGGEVSRRRFLRFSAASLGGIPGVWGTTRRPRQTVSKEERHRENHHAQEIESNEPVDIRGAIYIPARAFNRFQMWRGYDPRVIDRDLEYASRLNLNAIRTWLSYEYWRLDRETHEVAVDHFLTTAEKYDIRVVLGLFDSIGREPTIDNLTNADLQTAVQTFSPSTTTMKKRRHWNKPKQFLRWFMDRYRDDQRLLAIELSNEPGWSRKDINFMKEMAKVLTKNRGHVPLTVGSTSLANNAEYLDWGMDTIQFHYNFAQTTDNYRRVLRQAKHIEASADYPVWLTEWQRIRPGDSFFSKVRGDARFPNYSSLAPLIQRSGVGNFFWSLMLRPASSLFFRNQGVINGVFHEDGTVWSRDDARAIKAMSGDPSFDGHERTEYPDWMETLNE